MRLLILTLILGFGIFLLAANTNLVSDAVVFFTVGGTNDEEAIDPAIMLAFYLIVIIAIGYIAGFLHGKAHAATREYLKRFSSSGKSGIIVEPVVVYEKKKIIKEKKTGKSIAKSKNRNIKEVSISLKGFRERIVPFLKSSKISIAVAAGLVFKFAKRHSRKVKEKAMVHASRQVRTTWPQIVYAVKAVAGFVWRVLQAIVVSIEKIWAWFKDPR